MNKITTGMNKSAILTSVVWLLCFSSCNFSPDIEPDKPVKPEELVGSWQGVPHHSTIFDEKEQKEYNTDIQNYIFTLHPDHTYTLTFKPDKNNSLPPAKGKWHYSSSRCSPDCLILEKARYIPSSLRDFENGDYAPSTKELLFTVSQGYEYHSKKPNLGKYELFFFHPDMNESFLRIK